MQARARHRKPPDLLGRVIFLAMALIAMGAGLIPGVISASAAPAVPARPAAVVIPVHRDAPVLPPVTSAARTARVTPASYLVRTGDTLSGIATRLCGHANDWTGIYAASRRVVGTDPNMIVPGQLLAIRCTDPPALLRLGHATAPARVTRRTSTGGRVWGVTYGWPNKCGDGDGDGWDVACTSRQAPAPVAHSQSHGYSGTYHGSGSMQQCIIARESGGNSQVMNGSGHYGLFQFSESTWIASGGSASAFGHASVAEQVRVFDNAVAARGYSDWAPYDGC